MPIYDYKCCECGKKFEILVMNKNEEIICPACESDNLKKTFSIFSGRSCSLLKKTSTNSGCSRKRGFS